MIVKIENLVWEEVDHYPFMTMIIDGIDVTIPLEQRLGKYGGISARGDGIDDHPDFQFILPADPADGRPVPELFKGFTQKAEIHRLYRHFVDALDRGVFRPGPVDVRAALRDSGPALI